MRRKVPSILTVCLFGLAIALSRGDAANMADYCALPIELARTIPPNVMLIVDNSGSMFRFAYFDGWDTPEANDDNLCTSSIKPCSGFNPNKAYYGYFDPNSWYKYEKERFSPSGSKTQNKNKDEWDGNFLNWLTMRRVDVLRKVLTGGRLVSEGGENRLVGEPPDNCALRGRYKKITNAEKYTPFSGEVTFDVCGSSGEAYFKVSATEYKIKVALGDITPKGIIQRVGTKIRWGLSFYHKNAPDPEGGYVQAPIQERDNASLENSVVNEINNKTPDSNTPLAESLWTVAGYFAQKAKMLGGPGPRYQSGDYQINNNVDPFNYGTGGQVLKAWCAKNFVILITDGEPCADGNLPNVLKNYASGRSPYNCDGRSGNSTDPCYIPSCDAGGYVPGIEDVALWVHTNDLRDDLEGKQTLTIYPIFAFGQGSRLLEYAAKNGGFEDKNGNNSPDLQEEWDKDGDGKPDNYYAASSGEELEAALIAAITDILNRVSSGTSVAVLSTSAKGEGTVFQAYYIPVVYEGAEERTWFGYLQGLWIDRYGKLREDTVPDWRLVPTGENQDRIIHYEIDPSSGDTVVSRWLDSDGNREEDQKVDILGLQEINALWEAGRKLASTNTESRNIYTLLPQEGMISFAPDRASDLKPYLGVNDDATAKDIIRFIRGEHIEGFRPRDVTIDGTKLVWKLGDIIHSTPVVVSRPMGNYHLIYGDQTFTNYYNAHKKRRSVVYVGANDGMLHAFNAGFYHEGDKPRTDHIEEGWWEKDEYEYGQELWAYIPYNLLPHLKWLANPNYCHVYYVDLKPEVFDARIFPEDENHVKGWGTVLVGGMRLGGAPIETEVGHFASSYFALDITDPENPQLLWEFTDPDLGFTTSQPAIMRLGGRDQPGTWYVVFGSGPTTFKGESDRTTGAFLYVLDLKTGVSKGKIDLTKVDRDLPKRGVFVASPITVDLGLDYDVDLIYVPVTYKKPNGSWAGEIIRIKTNESADPGDWEYGVLIKFNQPITSAPSVSLDSYGRLWLYWGTGRYYSELDKADLSEQRIYGVWDPMDQEIHVTALSDVTAVTVYEGGHVDKNNDGSADTTFTGYLQERRESYNQEKSYGWYLRLSDGERVLDKPVIVGGTVLIPSFKPTHDICGYGGDSYLYAIYYETGTAYEEPIIGTGDRTIEVPPGEPKHEILRKRTLGKGTPTSVVVHTGQEEGAVSLIQLGTGQVVEVPTSPAFSPKSGVILWREKM